MKRTALTIALLFSSLAVAQSPTPFTVTRNDAAVLNGPGGSVSITTPLALGVSMGGYGVFGSGQLPKNLLAGSGEDGLEPVQSGMVWVQPAAGTGTYNVAGANTWQTQTQP